MGIMVEFILLNTDFPIRDVYKNIGLEGEMQIEDSANFPMENGANYLREKTCSITYSTKQVNTLDVNIPINQLTKLLQPCKREILDSIKEYNLSSKFCIEINLSENPIIYFPKDFIKLAAEFNSSIEVDSYIEFEADK